MKTFIFLSLYLVAFYSCKKSSNSPDNTIVGKWYQTQSVLSESINGAHSGGETTTYPNKSKYTIFNSNGTGTTVTPDTTISFTYVFSGSSLFFTPNNNNATFTFQSLTSNGFVLHEVFSFLQGSSTTVNATFDDYYSK